jgi:hypothetical protein
MNIPLKLVVDISPSGIFWFTGPVLLLFAMIFEWIMGNFLSMMIMGMFAVYWLSFAVLQTPSWMIAQSYSATGNAAEGAASKGYNAAIALYLMVWGFWLFTTFIFTLKTNTIFAGIFFFAFMSSFIIGGAYWKVSTGDYDMAMTLQKVIVYSNEMREVTDQGTDWSGNLFHRCDFRILYYGRDDGCGDEDDSQASGWRFVAFLAKFGYLFGGYGEAGVDVVIRPRVGRNLEDDSIGKGVRLVKGFAWETTLHSVMIFDMV